MIKFAVKLQKQVRT